ncbi:glycerophosphodiester phosphodiesterase [Arsenicicoccus sp. oral taxon 190]|nr:glycerophosphodiester phosphodiesterase [Arsenicicoccus sp. oral taxon 190]
MTTPVADAAGAASAATAAGDGSRPKPVRAFDLQAHRGGIGLTTEESPEGFAKALELGVTTLELDTQVTKDLKVVVTHDRQVAAGKCADTAPVVAGDPMYPYVGKYIKDLTLAQIKSMNCGYQQLPGFPRQEVIWGNKMAELRDVFAVVRAHRAKKVMMNIETKVEAGAPEQTMERNLFVRTVYGEIARSGLKKQVTIQSFDWGALKVMHRLDRSIPLVALTNYDFLQVGKPGASPWLGGIDADDFGGDFVAAAASIEGVTTLSPNYGFPQNGKVGEPGFRLYADAAMTTAAHRRGLKVVPWTVDDPATMQALIDNGVDGFITNYPDLGRRVMSLNGLRLPKAYPSR